MKKGHEKLSEVLKERYQKDLKSSVPSKGYYKLWNYFKALIKTSKFNDEVIQLRKRYTIPLEGLGSRSDSTTIQFLERITSEKRFSAFTDDLLSLITKYHLSKNYWWTTFLVYYLYGEFEMPDDFGENLCMVDSFEFQTYGADPDDINFNFPVLIRISPYATSRDILDFVNKNYKYIEIIQKNYQKSDVKIGKIRQSKKAKRNDFIFNNRKLKLCQIADLVTQKFNEDLDHGLISKIISLENKRRKEL